MSYSERCCCYVCCVCVCAQFSPIYDCLRLLPCSPIGSSVAEFSCCLFLRPPSMYPVPILLVPSCHMASTFPLQTPSLCHGVFRIGSVPATCHSKGFQYTTPTFTSILTIILPFGVTQSLYHLWNAKFHHRIHKNPATGSHSERGGLSD